MSWIREWEEVLRPQLEDISSLIASKLKLGDVYIDIGANTGLLTQMIFGKLDKKYGNSLLSKVYLFEPVPYLAQDCRHKFYDYNQVIVEELALSNDNRPKTIFASRMNLGYNTISEEKEMDHPSDKYTIHCDTFSHWAEDNNLTNAGFIKIDVEGHEVNVLRGMFDWLRKTGARPPILFEHGWEKAEEEAVVNDMVNFFGYTVQKKEKDYYLSVPKMTFVIPTLGRPEGLKRCLDSIKGLNYPPDKIEVIVKQDSVENRIGVPKLLKQGVEESTGDWIVFGSNDIEFTPNSIREALLEGDGGYVSFNTGEVYLDEGNINEHFMIRKDIIKKIGDVFDTDFWHVGCDNLLWAKMKKLGIAKRSDRAVVNHYHWSKTPSRAMDETYSLGWSHVDEDRLLLTMKLLELDSQ